MIEGTPQLHANAWKVSSACVAPVNLPIVDPCEMNQNNGNNDNFFFFTVKYEKNGSGCLNFMGLIASSSTDYTVNPHILN